MLPVHAAVEAGRCVLAVGAHLLRDPEVLLNLSDRAAGLPAVALSGAVVSPVLAVGADSLARATGQKDGVVVLIEPEDADWAGLESIAEQLKASAFKPRVFVIGKPPQPLRFSMLFRGIPVDAEKGRGAAFIKKLPVPDPAVAAEVVAAPAKQKALDTGDLPRRVFVGREDEVAALKELLSEGGPIVVSGPEGVGRNSLIDAAVREAGLTRAVDVTLGRGAGFDHLVGRVSALLDDAGDSSILEKVSDPKAHPVLVAQTVLEALASAESLSSTVLVVQPLEVAAGRELDFFRKDALGYFVQRLMGARYPLRLVFVAQGQPAAFDHAMSQTVRRFEVEGIKGRFYHEIFAACQQEDVPRDKFGSLSERLHGHPMAVRLMALEVRDREEGVALLDDPKLLASESLADLTALRKRLKRRVEKLPEPLRVALGKVAHLRFPATGGELNDLGIARKERLALLRSGLLDEAPGDGSKRYFVHPLVMEQLRYREMADFEVMAQVGAMYKRQGSEAQGATRLAYGQEANRAFFGSRKYRDVVPLRCPDHDPEVEAITGMIRSKTPHFELARERVTALCKARPGCSDAHLLKLELMRKLNAPREAVEKAMEEAVAAAPVPEVFHEVATTLLGRKARGQAIALLESGIELMPDEVRLKTRLASLLLREGRRNEALARLKEAMEQAPMLPDAYGLLGMARFDEGESALADAETLLREAVRLAPNDPVQVPRLVHVLLAKARIATADESLALQGEARGLLSEMTRDERKSPEGFLMLARLELEVGNVDRAEWLLEQASKKTERRHERSLRIRLEKVFVALHKGALDDAEREARALVEKDPSHHRMFVALSQVLERRGQFIPAHAEMLRAQERVSQASLEGRWVAGELLRIQGLIEQEMARMAAGLPAVEPAAGSLADVRVPTPFEAPRAAVRRRKTGAKSDETPSDGGNDSVEAAESTVEPVVDESPSPDAG